MKIDFDRLESEDQLPAARALAPVLEATQPSKFRLLRVVCPGTGPGRQHHSLLDVYRTGIGPVYIGARRAVVMDLNADLTEARRRGERRARQVLGDLRAVQAARARGFNPDDLPVDGRDPMYYVSVSCRCATRTIPLFWLQRQLDAPPRTGRVSLGIL